MRKRQLEEEENGPEVSEDRRIRPKLSSVIGKVNHNSINDSNPPTMPQRRNSIKSVIEIPFRTEKPQIQYPSTPDLVERNRRMFAGMMGHLVRAKDRLEQDSSSIEKQALIKSEAVQKREEDARKLAEQRRKVRLVEKKKIDILQNMDELTVQIDQVTKLTDRFKSSQEHFKRFLMTYNSEKAIYWLPKEHNEKTTKLLQNREPEILKVIAEREIEDENKKLPLTRKYDELKSEMEMLENEDTIESEDQKDNIDNDVVEES